MSECLTCQRRFQGTRTGMAASDSSSAAAKQQALLFLSPEAESIEATAALADEAVKEVFDLMEEEHKIGSFAPYFPIVYGSISFKIKQPAGPKTEGSPATHRWTREQSRRKDARHNRRLVRVSQCTSGRQMGGICRRLSSA
jgi:hypothetical protein